LKQGIGLEIVPSLAVSDRKNFLTGDSSSYTEPSLDLAYRITPQLNASLTINTDFSATEVDDRQVNLTRLGLFFPEKRDFFLREADIFEFGGIGGQRQSSIPGLNTLAQNGRPFFSRRIGLSTNGEVVDLEYGGKLSGRVGQWELGALSVRQDEHFVTVPSNRLPEAVQCEPIPDGTASPLRSRCAIPADTLSVARAKLGVLGESNVGIIATQGSPTAALDNSLAGVDFQYRNTRFAGGRTLETDVFVQRSDTEGRDGGDDAAYGLSVRFPSSQGFRGIAQYREYERHFNPGLGFIDSAGVSDAFFNVGYMLRPSGGALESWLLNFDYQRINYLDGGGLKTEAFFFRPFTFTNRTGDSIMLAISDFTERLVEPFPIYPGVLVPVGTYDADTVGIQAGTGNHRKLAAFTRIVEYPEGRFYGGRRSDRFLELTWRPSARFRGSLSYELNDVELPLLPNGSFEIRLVRAGFDVAFSPTLSWVNLIQYDTVSEVAGINMRLHWIPEAGREVYFVINHNVEDLDRDNNFHSSFSDATAKINYTFRF
jgi:hypothetical protein